jgi:hypothetical protein
MLAKRCLLISSAVTLCAGTLCAGMLCAGIASAQTTTSQVAVWDTRHPSADRLLAKDLLQRDGWGAIGRRQNAASFDGDAVMTNGQIFAVVRKTGAEVDLYSGGEQPIWRTRLRLQAAGQWAERLTALSVIERTRAAVRLEAGFETANGDKMTAQFRLKRGGVALEVVPTSGADLLRVDVAGRYVVMPDFFADDILIDATQIPVPAAELPSENFLLHMTGQHDAITMCVFENSDQDVKVTFDGEGESRVATGSEIRFGAGRRVWVSVLSGPGIWYAHQIRQEDAGEIQPLSWAMPFAAQWRVDFTRQNGLTDSWEMLYPAPGGDGYIKPSWLPGQSSGNEPSRTATGEIDVDAYKVGGPASSRLGPDRQRWITVLGRFQYPCWTDQEDIGYIQPLDNKAVKFAGPAVIYPINRLPGTPINTYTTVDVMRATLGVGPCEYILNVESQRSDHVGRATCHVRRLLNEIYEGRRQKSMQSEIETYLTDGMDFVKHIRDRISLYVEFGHQMRDYLATQKKAHPELAKSLDELDEIASQLNEQLDARRDGIKTIRYVAGLNDGFRKNLLAYDGPDSLTRLKEYTDALTKVGGTQDTLVGNCRWIVRTLRQRAAMTMAVDPRFADIAAEIRTRTQTVLLKPSAYEGARH